MDRPSCMLRFRGTDWLGDVASRLLCWDAEKEVRVVEDAAAAVPWTEWSIAVTAHHREGRILSSMMNKSIVDAGHD